MKACVVEIKGTLAAVLSDDGRIRKVKNRDYAIGQVIEMGNRTLHFSVKTAALAACVAVVLLLSTVTAWAYCTPYSYVSLDVNPSVEFSVNRFDRVLSAKAVNHDGAEILNGLGLNNKTIDQAVLTTVEKINSEGYFKDSGGIIIATSGSNEQDYQKLAEDLKNAVVEETKDSGSPVEVQVISVRLERVQEAQKLGTTPGKLNLVEKLQASHGEENINISDWLNKPVKEIMKAIKAAKQQSKPSETKDSSSSENTISDSESSLGSDTESQVSSSPVLSQKKTKTNASGKAAGSAADQSDAGSAPSQDHSASSGASSQGGKSSAVRGNVPQKGNSQPDASESISSSSAQENSSSTENGPFTSSAAENKKSSNGSTKGSSAQNNGNDRSNGKNSNSKGR